LTEPRVSLAGEERQWVADKWEADAPMRDGALRRALSRAELVHGRSAQRTRHRVAPRRRPRVGVRLSRSRSSSTATSPQGCKRPPRRNSARSCSA